MWLGLLLLVVLVVWAVSTLSMGRGGNQSPPAAQETPLDILQKRYARGEIDREEYEQRRRDLQGP